MTTLFVHGFVQMWTKKTGMTKSKEACIEIVEGKFVAQNEWQGLPNLGNTCYVNVVLQALFSIPSFGDDLLAPSVIWGQVPYTGLTLYFSINLCPTTKENPLSIQSSLDYSFAPEELEYVCEKCAHNGSTAILRLDHHHLTSGSGNFSQKPIF
ncbi:ubiquitin carboxyl-terminal hydrolase 26 [Rhynchocyon petersi]